MNINKIVGFEPQECYWLPPQKLSEHFGHQNFLLPEKKGWIYRLQNCTYLKHHQGMRKLGDIPVQAWPCQNHFSRTGQLQKSGTLA